MGSHLHASTILTAAVPFILTLAASDPVAATEPVTNDNGEALQEVVVTGSRVITNGNDSPTPVTVVTAEQLTATTPTDLADALNNLPVFSGSSGQADARQSTLDNTAGDYLNLRGLGSVRNLILFDGHRVPPTSSVGTVDVDSLPQMLIQRVDVVTGGASAVYGSDAISGVVNFIVDRNFNGVKVEGSYGQSGLHDDDQHKLGIAAGTNFDGGAGHIEGSFQEYSSAGLPSMLDRAAGREVYTVEGAGTVASPYHTVPGGSLYWATAGGYVIPLVPGPLAGYTFLNNNGAIAPATPSDLSYVQSATPLASLKSDQGYVRVDFDVTDRVHLYAQADLTATASLYTLTPLLYVFKWILPDDAFLPAAARTALAGAGGGPFLFGKDAGSAPGFVGDAHGHNTYANLGMSGKLFNDASFEFSYTHGESQQLTTTLNNLNNLRLAAALDAVVNPATGNIVCGSTLTNPSAFPGCVPLNPFGPTSETPAMLQYIEQNTSSLLTNRMDDVLGSLVGAPFSTWAGPVRGALTAELRADSLRNVGVDNAVNPATDCAALSLSALTCPSTRYTSPAAGDSYGSETVRELALEANVPLLKDLFLARNLDFDAAFRNAHYTTSGNANTWKAGLVWTMTDELTMRWTRSRDFRAPTLTDLYGPVSDQPTGFTDLHTGVNGITIIQSGGNPNLKPEVGYTTTVGFVFRPTWAKTFSAAVDIYSINISNAIASFSGADPSVQQQCEASGGVSPACDLFVRPLPFSNHTAANFPTLVYAEGLNLSNQSISGIDGDLNYTAHLGPGNLSLRGLVTFQPKDDTQAYPGAPIVYGAGTAPGVSTNSAASVASGGAGLAKWKATGFVAYRTGPYEIDIQTRWRDSLKQTNNTAVSSDPDVPSVSFTDLTLAYTPPVQKADLRVYLTVQNVFNKAAPIYQQPGSANAPGYFYPAVSGDDIVGRYFTLGVRARL